MHSNLQNTNKHIPVLVEPVLNLLKPLSNERYLDLTAGYGGHASRILELTGANNSVLVDRDTNAIRYLESLDLGATILHKDFYTACVDLLAAGEQFDIILADLGVSSPHLDNASRGFAFATEGPLDMRMDQSQALTADVVVNTYAQDNLERIIREYGEEPRARTVAKAIVDARPLSTTTQLAQIVRSALPKTGKTHPATRTFQALRIAVNDELELLRAMLPEAVRLLKPGGRMGVISFHSLEDRIVKQTFADYSGNRYDAPLKLLTKRPVTAERSELVFNPRARSAKLRAVVKK